LASLASAIFGIGQLIGSPLVGILNDRYGGGSSVAQVIIVIHIIAYTLALIYNEIHVFGPLAYLLAFALGV
jgi:predicted MFS family arabinose efflux permease